MTPHNEAQKEDIAKVVLMPGDPKRAEYIAKNYLTDYKLVNSVRGMLAYTGFYRGKRLTVMASGMGMPSIGIYSYELFKFYDVDTIIRVGSIGAYDESLKIYDIILAEESYAQSTFAEVQNGSREKILKSSQEVNAVVKETAREMGLTIHPGRIYSSDVFYQEHPNIDYLNKEMKCLGTEMESFALYHNASVCGKRATCLVTVSDHLRTHEELSADKREKSFNAMMELALNTAIKLI